MDGDGFAARWSADIAGDLRRGHSFAGHGFRPAASAEDARKALYAHNVYDAVVYSVDLGGWLPALEGLSAYFDEDRATAIVLARQDRRWAGRRLYVFRAEYLCEDTDTEVVGVGAAVVRVCGDAEEVV